MKNLVIITYHEEIPLWDAGGYLERKWRFCWPFLMLKRADMIEYVGPKNFKLTRTWVHGKFNRDFYKLKK